MLKATQVDANHEIESRPDVPKMFSRNFDVMLIDPKLETVGLLDTQLKHNFYPEYILSYELTVVTTCSKLTN